MKPFTDEDKQLFDIAFPILQALLASGHYTRPSSTEDGAGEPFIFTKDNGKDWKENYFPQRHQSSAVFDAIELASEFAGAIRHENKPIEEEES